MRKILVNDQKQYGTSSSGLRDKICDDDVVETVAQVNQVIEDSNEVSAASAAPPGITPTPEGAQSEEQVEEPTDD